MIGRMTGYPAKPRAASRELGGGGRAGNPNPFLI